MNNVKRIASTVGTAVIALGLGTVFAGAASAMNVPPPHNCGQTESFQEVHGGYIYRYEPIGQEGNKFWYGVTVPNVPAGWVPVGQVECTV
ncbi:hypothetical protein [Nocardia fluminea]|uniref:hypothetical protein n=1 Tax=Nocardia fluminea TaxID=134984 RepID=UPI003652227F